MSPHMLLEDLTFHLDDLRLHAVAAGPGDGLLPEMALESLEFCTNGRCEVLPGVSHWIQHEEPERVSTALITHFDHYNSQRI